MLKTLNPLSTCSSLVDINSRENTMLRIWYLIQFGIEKPYLQKTQRSSREAHSRDKVRRLYGN